MTGLFGPAVGAATPGPELRALGARMPGNLRLGTSSWSFPGWSGVWDRAYDKALLSREGLAAYAAHPVLGAVGLDRTYYGPMSARELRGLAEQVPSEFRFLVKAHEHLTVRRFPKHPRYGARAGEENPRFLDPGYARDAVVGPVSEGLGARLGTLLFQFPPMPAGLVGGPEVFAERLHAFLDALPRGLRYAVEIRTRAWLGRPYADALVAAGASHAYVSHPAMPPIAEQVRAVPGGARHGLVVRWMLRHDLDYESAKAGFAPFSSLSAPDPAVRSDIARLVGLALGRDKEVLVIVNNKAEGSSPLSCVELARAVVG